jgi:sulfide:quinone oxidoreductase
MGNAVVVGAGYAGLAAALELRSRLPAAQSVTLISIQEEFIFHPSLIWVVQGERELSDISFSIRPALQQAGISFVQGRLELINPAERSLTLSDGRVLNYEKLIIATGGEWHWDTMSGMGPRPAGYSVSMLSPQAALQARASWQALLAHPGPIVIGLALQASLYGAAYEFALNLDIALRKAERRRQCPITFITPEPYLGHLGHDGLGDSRRIIEEAFASRQIKYVTEAQIDHLTPDEVVLSNVQERFPSKFTMIVPPAWGIRPVRLLPDLGDEQGHIPVDDYYRSRAYPDIFAAGAAVRIKPQVTTLLPCGVMLPGTASATMGRIAAANLAADLGHGALVRRDVSQLKSFYVLDSGGRGLFMSLGSQSWLNLQLNIPGPWSHWAKVVAEKYQMWQLRSGRY